MLFKRRTPASWSEVLRISLWPRRSWFRSTQYVTKRILRITATPHAVAAGVAAGVFTSFTPLMGLHFLVAFVLAWLIGGNLIASALGTFFGNPISFPIIWTGTYNVGHYVLNSSPQESGPVALAGGMKEVLGSAVGLDWNATWQALVSIWEPLLYPMIIGGLPLGLTFSIPAYFITKRATAMFRERRRNQLLEKASEVKRRATQRNSALLAGERGPS